MNDQTLAQCGVCYLCFPPSEMTLCCAGCKESGKLLKRWHEWAEIAARHAGLAIASLDSTSLKELLKETRSLFGIPRRGPDGLSISPPAVS